MGSSHMKSGVVFGAKIGDTGGLLRQRLGGGTGVAGGGCSHIAGMSANIAGGGRM